MTGDAAPLVILMLTLDGEHSSIGICIWSFHECFVCVRIVTNITPSWRAWLWPESKCAKGVNEGSSLTSRLTTCLMYIGKSSNWHEFEGKMNKMEWSPKQIWRVWGRTDRGPRWIRGDEDKVDRSTSWIQGRLRSRGSKSKVRQSSSKDKVERDRNSNSNIKPKASKYTGVVLKY